MPPKQHPPRRRRSTAAGAAAAPAIPGGVFGSTDRIEHLQQLLRDNERIWEGFRRIEIALIGAQTPTELIAVLASQFPRTFPRVDCATLACVDPEYEIARMLDTATAGANGADDAAVSPHFIALDKDALAGVYSSPPRPWLGIVRDDLRRLLFPRYRGALGSVALAPLVLRGQLIGSLNQASGDPAHFAPGTATDLLEHLAAVAAMCIDNAVNRERLRQYGLMDALTGVANRRFFDHRLQAEVECWFRRQEPLSCIVVDADRFKDINDRFGHHTGDRVLQEIARLLGRELRAADVLARYGGEEFALLLPHTPRQHGIAIAERLCAHIASHPFATADGPLAVTVSIGVACLNNDSDLDGQPPAAWLLQQADAAMYRAKHAGRNRVIAA